MDEELQRVLEAREQRWEMRKMLAESWQSSLITVTLCVPVKFRTSDEFWILFQRLCNTFKELLISKCEMLTYESYTQSDDGPAFFAAVKADAEELKRICVEAEELIQGGRMLDIDVMDSSGAPVSRSDIGLPPRKCFICDNPAALCVSRRLHSQDEVFMRVKQLKDEAGC